VKKKEKDTDWKERKEPWLANSLVIIITWGFFRLES
jgi:hypothetical protein